MYLKFATTLTNRAQGSAQRDQVLLLVNLDMTRFSNVTKIPHYTF